MSEYEHIWKADVVFHTNQGTEPQEITVESTGPRENGTVRFKMDGSTAVLKETRGKVLRNELQEALEYVSDLPMVQAATIDL